VQSYSISNFSGVSYISPTQKEGQELWRFPSSYLSLDSGLVIWGRIEFVLSRPSTPS